MSLCLENVDKNEEALAAVEETVKIYRRALAMDPTTPDIFFTASLYRLSHLLRDMDSKPEALSAIEEAAGIYRKHAVSNADKLNIDFAM